MKTITLQPKIAKENSHKEKQTALVEPPKPEAPAKKAESAPKKTEAPVKKPQPVKKKAETAPKKVEKTKSSPPKPKEITEKKASITSANKALIDKAQDSIAKIKAPDVKMSPSIEESKPLKYIAMEPVKETVDLSYEHELSQQLKLLMKLPEPGTALVDVTIDRFGNVKNIVIIKAASGLNKKYIEKTLPRLAMPPFGIYFRGLEQKTFRLELRSDL